MLLCISLEPELGSGLEPTSAQHPGILRAQPGTFPPSSGNCSAISSLAYDTSSPPLAVPTCRQVPCISCQVQSYLPPTWGAPPQAQHLRLPVLAAGSQFLGFSLMLKHDTPA